MALLKVCQILNPLHKRNIRPRGWKSMCFPMDNGKAWVAICIFEFYLNLPRVYPEPAEGVDKHTE
jgi:hypothetical protein